MQSTENWTWEFQRILDLNPFPFFHRVGLHHRWWENYIRLQHEARIPNEMENTHIYSTFQAQKALSSLKKFLHPWPKKSPLMYTSSESLPLSPVIHKFLSVIHSYPHPPLTYHTMTPSPSHYHYLLLITFTIKQLVLTDLCKIPLILEMESC